MGPQGGQTHGVWLLLLWVTASFVPSLHPFLLLEPLTALSDMFLLAPNRLIQPPSQHRVLFQQVLIAHRLHARCCARC